MQAEVLILPDGCGYQDKSVLFRLGDGALRYCQDQLNAQNTERAFWFGMSNASEDSVDDLLKLLDKPTVPAMFGFIEVLKQRHTQDEFFHAGLADQFRLSVYRMGVAEAY